MASYDELKQELGEIAKLLGSFPEAIQPKVFDILVQAYMGPQSAVEEPVPVAEDKTPRQEPAAPRKRTTPKEPSYQQVRNLNLEGADGKQSFPQFYGEKNPKGSNEFNAVAIYYLTRVLGLSGITPDHVYTCYNRVNHLMPQRLKQSLYDAASKNQYIDTSDVMNDLKMTHRGVTLVEQELPRSKDKK